MSLPPLLGLLNLLGVGALVAWATTVINTAWSLTHPPRRTYAWAVSRKTAGDPGELTPARTFETFTFRGRSEELPAWRVPGDAPDGPIVVLTHGWGSSRVGGLKRLRGVLPHAREAVLWDLPGHGEAPGTARMGIDEHEDLLALLSTIGDGPFVLFGWSLGAGVSIRAAAESGGTHDIRAVIAEAPYIDAPTPARNVIRLRGLPYRLNLRPAMKLIGMTRGAGVGWSGFARDKHAERLGSVPLTVIHGDADPVCPIADGRAIAEAAPNGRLVAIAGGGHNNLWMDPVFSEAASDAVGAAIRGAVSAPESEPSRAG